MSPEFNTINPESLNAIPPRQIPEGRRKVHPPFNRLTNSLAAAIVALIPLSPFTTLSAIASENHTPQYISGEVQKQLSAKDIRFWNPAEIADLIVEKKPRPPIPTSEKTALNNSCRPLNGTGKPCLTTQDLDIYYNEEYDIFEIKEKRYPIDINSEKQQVFEGLQRLGLSPGTIVGYPMKVNPSGR